MTFFKLLILAPLVVPSACALTLAQFTDCVGSNAGMHASPCELSASGTPYSITSTIVVSRHNVVARGDGATPADTHLIRGAANIPLLSIGNGITGVKIQNLKFNGNSGAYSTSSAPELAEQGTSTIIEDCLFIGAAVDSINISGSSFTLVRSSTFSGSLQWGIWAGNGAIYTNIQNSIFTTAGANAIWIAGVTNGSVSGNTFTDNHCLFPYGVAGGQVGLEAGSQYVTITANDFDGGSLTRTGMFTAAIEAWGNGHTFAYNNIFDHLGPGIYCNDCTNVTIIGDYPNGPLNYKKIQLNHNATYSTGFGGVEINSLYNQSSGVTITTLSIINNAGHGIIIDSGPGMIPIHNLTVTNNCLAGNGSPNNYPVSPPQIFLKSGTSFAGTTTVSGNTMTGCS